MSKGARELVTDRVRKHRENMAKQGCQRLEVMIGRDVVEKMRALAKRRQCRLWQVVEAACEEYAKAASNEFL